MLCLNLSFQWSQNLKNGKTLVSSLMVKTCEFLEGTKDTNVLPVDRSLICLPSNSIIFVTKVDKKLHCCLDLGQFKRKSILESFLVLWQRLRGSYRARVVTGRSSFLVQDNQRPLQWLSRIKVKTPLAYVRHVSGLHLPGNKSSFLWVSFFIASKVECWKFLIK